MTTDEDALLAEANRINYRLRSTFFYRKLREYGTSTLPVHIAALCKLEHLYDWGDRHSWGIGDNAFDYVQHHSELHLIQVFCHPKLLREHPRLVAYYRNIAALSQKAVGYLVRIDVKPFETSSANRRDLNDYQALTLARLFNEHLTLIVDGSLQRLRIDDVQGILFASTGAQMDGSWRNAIGDEAEQVVQRLLAKEAMERALLAGLIARDGVSVDTFIPERLDEQLGGIERYRGLMLTNGTSILFSSEPDVSLLSAQGKTTGVIEVKGGADPAGALERCGAAKKSFESALKVSPDAKTILVASCITPEVRTRILHDTTISSYFNLTELLVEDSQTYNQFMSEVFSLFAS